MIANALFSALGHAHFHPGVAGVEVETGVAEEAGVVVKDMVVEELVLLAEEVIGLLRLFFYFTLFPDYVWQLLFRGQLCLINFEYRFFRVIFFSFFWSAKGQLI